MRVSPSNSQQGDNPPAPLIEKACTCFFVSGSKGVTPLVGIGATPQEERRWKKNE